VDKDEHIRRESCVSSSVGVRSDNISSKTFQLVTR